MTNRWINALDPAKYDEATRLYREDVAGDSVRAEAGDDADYGVWLLVADVYLRECREIGIGELTDFDWRSRYDADLTPYEAVREAVQEEGLVL